MDFFQAITVAGSEKCLFLCFTCIVSHTHFAKVVFLLQVYRPAPINRHNIIQYSLAW